MEEETSRRKKAGSGGRYIFTTLCRGVEKHIIIPLLIKLSCIATCRPVAWDAPFLHGTQGKYCGELSTQEYDAWGATQRQPLLRFLQSAPWLMLASPITRHACVHIPHTCEIEIFFLDIWQTWHTETICFKLIWDLKFLRAEKPRKWTWISKRHMSPL